MTRALITGITGQDGSYLAELLLEKGYEVHGVIRTTSQDLNQNERISHLLTPDPLVKLHVADLGDSHSLHRLIDQLRPTEVYNLAAQSHVRASFDMPVHTGEVTGLGVTRLLEAIRDIDPHIRFYQASSSELFGSAPPPQNERTPFHPRSPYAVAKLYGYWSTINYREAYGIHASNGILFNHESPRRGTSFVTRKITQSLASIVAGEIDQFSLGNVEARRDWGHARDYVRAMHSIMNHEEPLDVVIGTGETHSVEDFLDVSFGLVELEWRDYVVIDPELYRPAEVDYLQADPSTARDVLGWRPEIDFVSLVKEMVIADLQATDVGVPAALTVD